MAAKIEVPPELIAKGRYLYEHTDTPVHEIAAMFGMTRWTLNSRIRAWGWTRRKYPKGEGIVAAADADVAAGQAAVPAPMEPPLDFAERRRRVIDAEMQVAERILKVLGPASSAEAERTARIFAMVSRTVQDITPQAQGQTNRNEADDDPVPRDVDAFRIEIARRIRGFIESRRTGAD